MLQKYRAIIFSPLLFLLLGGCVTEINVEKEKQRLLQIDLEFSKLSVEKGSVEAFYRYMADDGIVLPRKGHPIRKDIYKEALSQRKPGNGTTILTWEPILADVTQSAGNSGYDLWILYHSLEKTNGWHLEICIRYRE
jgi:hypothetical protein